MLEKCRRCGDITEVYSNFMCVKCIQNKIDEDNKDRRTKKINENISSKNIIKFNKNYFNDINVNYKNTTEGKKIYRLYRIVNINKEVIYVGITTQTLKRRFNNGYSYNFDTIGCSIELIGETSDPTHENYWINYYKDQGCDLYNKKNGYTTEEYKKEYSLKYREANKDKMKEYYEANKDKIKEYYEANKDKIKEYCEANKDKIKEYSLNYREANKDKMKEYYEANKDKMKEYHDIYIDNNRAKWNKYQVEYKKKQTLLKNINKKIEDINKLLEKCKKIIK